MTGKPFSESAVCKAEIVIGNAADTNGFRVCDKSNIYKMTIATIANIEYVTDFDLQLAAHLRIPYDSLKESGLTKDQARELSEFKVGCFISTKSTKSNLF